MASSRGPPKKLLKTWLIQKLNNKAYPNVCWINREHMIFRIPWMHQANRDFDEADAQIFVDWSKENGTNKTSERTSDFKTRFRCAMLKSPYIEEVKDQKNTQKGEIPYKVFKILEQPKKGKGARESCHASPYRNGYTNGFNGTCDFLAEGTSDSNISSVSFGPMTDLGHQINIPTIGVQNTVTSGVGFTNVPNSQSVAQGNPSHAFMSNVTPNLNGNNGFLQQTNTIQRHITGSGYSEHKFLSGPMANFERMNQPQSIDNPQPMGSRKTMGNPQPIGSRQTAANPQPMSSCQAMVNSQTIENSQTIRMSTTMDNAKMMIDSQAAVNPQTMVYHAPLQQCQASQLLGPVLQTHVPTIQPSQVDFLDIPAQQQIPTPVETATNSKVTFKCNQKIPQYTTESNTCDDCAQLDIFYFGRPCCAYQFKTTCHLRDRSDPENGTPDTIKLPCLESFLNTASEKTMDQAKQILQPNNIKGGLVIEHKDGNIWATRYCLVNVFFSNSFTGNQCKKLKRHERTLIFGQAEFDAKYEAARDGNTKSPSNEVYLGFALKWFFNDSPGLPICAKVKSRRNQGKVDEEEMERRLASCLISPPEQVVGEASASAPDKCGVTSVALPPPDCLNFYLAVNGDNTAVINGDVNLAEALDPSLKPYIYGGFDDINFTI